MWLMNRLPHQFRKIHAGKLPYSPNPPSKFQNDLLLRKTGRKLCEKKKEKKEESQGNQL